MSEFEIEICKWDKLNSDEISTFVYENRIGIYREADNPEAIKRYLYSIHERFPAEVIIMVRKRSELFGWVVLDKACETVAELGRWQPIVKRSDWEEEVMGLLLKGIADHACRNGITRVEAVFNGVNKNNEDEYKKYAKWFTSNGFPKLEDNVYMTMQLEDKDIEFRPFPDGITVKSLQSVDDSDIYECYYNSFVTGKDRDFLDMDDTQRRDKFENSLHDDTVNQYLSSVLKDGEKIIGFVFVHSRDDEEHIDRFGILRDYRRKGLAKAHLLHVIHAAKEAGTPMISIGVDINNSSAFNLYKNVGFEIDSQTIIHTWKVK